MLDPNNPFASPHPSGFGGLETFDPFGDPMSPDASMYGSGCGGGQINTNCFCL